MVPLPFESCTREVHGKHQVTGIPRLRPPSSRIPRSKMTWPEAWSTPKQMYLYLFLFVSVTIPVSPVCASRVSSPTLGQFHISYGILTESPAAVIS